MKLLASVFLLCITAHVLAVWLITPESAANDSVLRLGWNDAQPDRADMLVLSLAVVVALKAHGLQRAGALILVAGGLSQLWAFLVWDAAPDYVLYEGRIWNASDVMILLGLAVCMVGTAVSMRQIAKRHTHNDAEGRRW